MQPGWAWETSFRNIKKILLTPNFWNFWGTLFKNLCTVSSMFNITSNALLTPGALLSADMDVSWRRGQKCCIFWTINRECDSIGGWRGSSLKRPNLILRTTLSTQTVGKRYLGWQLAIKVSQSVMCCERAVLFCSVRTICTTCFMQALYRINHYTGFTLLYFIATNL